MTKKLLATCAVSLLAFGLAACSSSEDQATPPSTNDAASVASARAATEEPGGVVGGRDAEVKYTKCTSDKTGVVIEAEVKNTSKERRQYIISAGVKDGSGKEVAVAAVMTDAVEAGATAKGTGKSSNAAQGELTCETKQISSMAMS